MKQIEHRLGKWLTPICKCLPPLYLVGGSVRDHLLSRTAGDIDLMCRDAEHFARRLADAGNAVVVPFLKKTDEPCYRVVDRQEPELFVDIAEMRGDTVRTDLEHRDFTVNAMAIRIGERGIPEEIIDPLNGREDLTQRLIRIAGPDAFISDPLRILRAIRFAAELGFTIEASTQKAMRAYAGLIGNVAGERIAVELLKIFAHSHAADFVRLMDELGIATVIFPEILPMKECAQNFCHHLDVWNHSLAVLEHCEDILSHTEDNFGHTGEKVRENLSGNNRIPLLKLTALLHDVGKPQTKSEDSLSGRITFYGHDKAGADIISEITSRLRMSARDRSFMQTLEAEHLHILNLSHPEVRPATRMRLFRLLKDDIIPLIILGMADIKSTLGPGSDKAAREHHLRWSEESIGDYYRETKKKLGQKNFVNGNDLIAMGISPGPEMGKLLRKLREAQDTGQVKDRISAIAEAKKLSAEYICRKTPKLKQT